MGIDQILAAILVAAISVVIGWFFSQRDTREKDVSMLREEITIISEKYDSLKDKVEELEGRSLTKEDVRIIVNDVLNPLQKQLNEIGKSINDVLLRLAAQDGYERAKKDYKRNNEDM